MRNTRDPLYGTSVKGHDPTRHQSTSGIWVTVYFSAVNTLVNTLGENLKLRTCAAYTCMWDIITKTPNTEKC